MGGAPGRWIPIRPQAVILRAPAIGERCDDHRRYRRVSVLDGRLDRPPLSRRTPHRNRLPPALAAVPWTEGCRANCPTISAATCPKGHAADVVC
jgi:hypothetical protein